MSEHETPILTRVIDARRPFRLVDVEELWRYREVVYFLVLRDFKLKYRQTVLGVGWAVLQPLVGLGVFSLVFGTLVGIETGGIPYPLFAVCGLVPWAYFSRAVPSTTNSLTSNPELVKKVYFPRLALPISACLAFTGDLMIGFVVLALTLIAFATAPAPQIVFLPAFVLLLVTTAFGIGLLTSATNARFRDVANIVPFMVQTLLFLTPVVYPSSLVPENLRLLYALNPIVGVIDGVRWSVLGTPLDPWMLALSVLVSVCLLIGGLAWFSKQEGSFADVL
jgi:lipopolysaccharide transport system permease protein